MKNLLKMICLFAKRIFLSPFRFLGSNMKVDTRGIEYVSGIKRQLSILIDLCLMLFFFYFVGIFLYKLFMSPSDAVLRILEKYRLGVSIAHEEQLIRNSYIYKALMIQLLQFILMVLYVVFCWVRYSATPGKLVFGLRVVDAGTLEKLSYPQALKRFFSLIISVLPLFLGVLWANFDSRRQAWHDKISNTVVVTYRSLKRYNT